MKSLDRGDRPSSIGDMPSLLVEGSSNISVAIFPLLKLVFFI